MKTSKPYLKIIALLLAILIVGQSCKVYYKESVTIQRVANTETQVKIITTENAKYIFDKILKENGQFFGVAKRGSDAGEDSSDLIVGDVKYSEENYNSKKIKLNEENIKEVFILNRKKSKQNSIIAGVTGGLGGLALILYLVYSSASFSVGLY